MRLVLSCEHGGNRVPPEARAAFRDAGDRLTGHTGWDPGALRLARHLARRTGAPLVATTVSRLVVETNRSPGHPAVLSPEARTLPPEVQQRLIRRYYEPHRARVEATVRTASRNTAVLHLGVHSFTPVWKGVPRNIAVGVLYDPARPRERRLGAAWAAALRAALPDLVIRRNAPYRGDADAVVTLLRRRLPANRYLGFELEVAQDVLAGPDRRRVTEAVTRTLRALLG